MADSNSKDKQSASENQGGANSSEARGSSPVVANIDLSQYFSRLSSVEPLPVRMRGGVKRIIGNVIEARMPNARIGELCSIEPPGREPVLAQVVGFDEEDIFLTPFDELDQIGPQTPVINHGHSLNVGVGPGLLGRVVDSLGNPIDGLGPISCSETYPLKKQALGAMERRRITEMMPVGVRAVDMCLSLGEGQRVGVFSAAGVGKSTLLGMISRNSDADVNVIALVGERGREVLDFLNDSLGPEGLERSVVVVSTSNDPPLRRICAAYTATAISEYFRDQGKQVMLLMDSVTRFARALREIALSVGEAPARQGYPPSVFTALPELLERAGNSQSGSITALYTVLLSTEQIEDALGEEVRAILDGHLYLTSRLANLQHFPAIDLMKSNSRLMDSLASDEHKALAEKLRRLWAIYEENRDLISIGAYKPGSDKNIDEAINKREKMLGFLRQNRREFEDLEQTLVKAAAVLE